MSTFLRFADRLFRIAGIATLAALAVTIAMLVLGAPEWRVPFVVAHLAALVALLPLGIALVAHAHREAGGVAPMIARHRMTAILLGVVAVSVAITLVEFAGNRAIRRASNTVTVALVALLIAQYLRWAARMRSAEARVTR